VGNVPIVPTLGTTLPDEGRTEADGLIWIHDEPDVPITLAGLSDRDSHAQLVARCILRVYAARASMHSTDLRFGRPTGSPSSTTFQRRAWGSPILGWGLGGLPIRGLPGPVAEEDEEDEGGESCEVVGVVHGVGLRAGFVGGRLRERLYSRARTNVNRRTGRLPVPQVGDRQGRAGGLAGLGLQGRASRGKRKSARRIRIVYIP